jgi:hypothetical protein
MRNSIPLAHNGIFNTAAQGYVTLVAAPGTGVSLRWDSDGDQDLDSQLPTPPNPVSTPVWLRLTRTTTTTFDGSILNQLDRRPQRHLDISRLRHRRHPAGRRHLRRRTRRDHLAPSRIQRLRNPAHLIVRVAEASVRARRWACGPMRRQRKPRGRAAAY